MSKWSLAGKKSLITGGTKGIGLAIVNEFVELGADVICVARQKSSDEIFKNSKVEFLEADVVNASSRQKITEHISERWGKLDVLVNNVGTNIRKRMVDYTEEEYRKVFEVNLFSMIEMSRLCFPFLKSSGSGSVINIASIAGRFDVQSGPPYGMTKAAIIQMTRSLAVEWAPFNIMVNSVSPWYIETPLTKPLFAQPGKLDKIIERTPMGRVGQPEEISGLVAFLAMDKASYISGEDFLIDGGTAAKGL